MPGSGIGGTSEGRVYGEHPCDSEEGEDGREVLELEEATESFALSSDESLDFRDILTGKLFLCDTGCERLKVSEWRGGGSKKEGS